MRPAATRSHPTGCVAGAPAPGTKRQRCVWIGAARQSGARRAKPARQTTTMRGPAIVRAGRRTLIAASLAHMRGVKAGQASPTTRTGPALCLHSPTPHLRGPTHTLPPRRARSTAHASQSRQVKRRLTNAYLRALTPQPYAPEGISGGIGRIGSSHIGEKLQKNSIGGSQEKARRAGSCYRQP